LQRSKSPNQPALISSVGQRPEEAELLLKYENLTTENIENVAREMMENGGSRRVCYSTCQVMARPCVNFWHQRTFAGICQTEPDGPRGQWA
jgi:hypothetical protein